MNLIAENLACHRNGRVVFSELSFTVRPGECLELRGANGAGKTSLLRTIAGLVPQAVGRLRFGDSEDLISSLHFVAHADAMKGVMTVEENLSFWCNVLGGSSIAVALSSFRLESLRNDAVQLLSAGQRRRLALSRLFLAQRPLWLLDEPMTALDKISQDELRGHLQSHLERRGLLIVATHGDIGLASDHVITLGAA